MNEPLCIIASNRPGYARMADRGVEEISQRTACVMEHMVVHFIETSPTPQPKEGRLEVFERLGPQAGNLDQASALGAAFDRIRNLDAEGSPPAFIETGGFRFEISKASRHSDRPESQVIIKRIEND